MGLGVVASPSSSVPLLLVNFNAYMIYICTKEAEVLLVSQNELIIFKYVFETP